MRVFRLQNCDHKYSYIVERDEEYTTNIEDVRIRKETAMAYFKVPSKLLP
jgi:hypothetical protein